MKSSPILRALELAKLAAKVGLKSASSGSLESRIEQAKMLADSLSQMKGAAMKAGQLLSLDLMDYFPKEATEILSRLQSSAEPADYSVIETVLRRDLGDERFSKLIDIEKQPIGSASIGQVHRATIDGKQTALKVQYPGVAESIDADLKILKVVAKSFCAMTGRDMSLDPLFNEFRNILNQEVDYLNEASLQNEYRERIALLPPIPGIHYVVPDVNFEFTTRHVLAMEFRPGIKLRNWMQGSPTGKEKMRLAEAILNLYFHEFFEWALVQTDPNQGNFLVHPRGSDLELVILDFGATRRYSQEFIKNYIELLRATGEGHRQTVRDQAISFGLIDSRESDEAFEALYQVLTVAVRPFFKPSFDFSDESHAKASQQTSRELANKLKYSPPPHDLVFLHRKLGGVYAVLKSLGVTMDVSSYWRNLV